MGNFYFVFICLHFPVFSNGHVLTFMIIKLHLTKWELVQKSTIKQVIDCNVLLFIKLQNCCQYTHFWGAGNVFVSSMCFCGAQTKHFYTIFLVFKPLSTGSQTTKNSYYIQSEFMENTKKDRCLKKRTQCRENHSS